MQINYNQIQNKNVADILIVTATNTETEALHSYLKPVCDDGILEIEKEGSVYYAGVLGGYNVVHCQCSDMGTQEAGSSILITTNAISAWPNIKVVIMVGIAFGMYEKEGANPQHYSDVLVAEKIFPYENQRINGNGTATLRGEEHFPSKDMIDAFTVISRTWKRKNIFDEDTKIEISPILSGEKLVDNIEFRDSLKKIKPEYRGGEMEGIGIASSCEKSGKQWILLKGICDFADGKKGTDKKEKQKDAAKAAVEACLQAFDTSNFSNLIGEKLNYRYRTEELDINSVFFIHYTDGCEPFYLTRDIDEEIKPYLKSKTCWVYGKSGIGKSELLNRTLYVNKWANIYCDLSICSKENVLESFEEILNVVCQKEDRDVPVVCEYRDVVKELCTVLNECIVDKEIFLLIDEIPFEYNSKEFGEFTEKFCSMVKYFGNNLKNTHVYFMLSSISDPTSSFRDKGDLINKIKQNIKFIQMEEWTECQAVQLIDKLSNYVKLDWNSYDKKAFAKELEYSPRKIKNALKEICSFGHRVITEEIVNKIKVS